MFLFPFVFPLTPFDGTLWTLKTKSFCYYNVKWYDWLKSHVWLNWLLLCIGKINRFCYEHNFVILWMGYLKQWTRKMVKPNISFTIHNFILLSISTFYVTEKHIYSTWNHRYIAMCLLCQTFILVIYFAQLFLEWYLCWCCKTIPELIPHNFWKLLHFIELFIGEEW